MSDLIDRWRKGRAEFYTEDSMYSIGDKMAAELEAVKAREEALVDAMGKARDILSRAAHYSYDRDAEAILTAALEIRRLAASEPPGTARPSLGEEGT